MRLLIDQGINPNNTFEVNKDIKIVNTIAVLGGGISLIFAMASLFIAQPLFAMLCTVASITMAILVYLNKLNKYAHSKFLLILVSPLLILNIAVNYGEIGAEYYLVAGLILIFFIVRKHRFRTLAFAYMILCFAVAKLSFEYIDIPASRASVEIYRLFNLVSATILTYLGLNLFVDEHKNHKKLIEEKNTELVKTKKEIEEQKGELENLNNVKDRLFSIISHDLKGPLRSLANLMELFSHEYVTSEQMKQQVPKASEQLTNTTNLVENLLTWTKTQLKGIHAKPQKFDLNQVVNDSVDLFNPNLNAKNINLTVKSNADYALVYADPEMIKTVLRNLTHNAIKFSNPDSSIEISVWKEENTVQLHVKDEGVGISKDLLKLILAHNKDISSKMGTYGEEGTGLGLLITKELVELNNGAFSAQANKDKGTTFSVFLPVP